MESNVIVTTFFSVALSFACCFLCFIVFVNWEIDKGILTILNPPAQTDDTATNIKNLNYQFSQENFPSVVYSDMFSGTDNVWQ